MNQKYLGEQELHASRESPTAATRPGAQRGDSIYWSSSGGPAANYVVDFRSHLKESNARTRKGAAIGLHILLGVSPAWIEETGGLHDVYNSRVQKLFNEAKAFAEIHVGGVFAIRLDLDERGGAVVDVYASPVHTRKGRAKKDGGSGPGVVEVSVKKSLSAMQKAVGSRSSFAALQTLWAKHVSDTLDSRVVRGVPKEVSGREHLSVAEFREAAEREKAHAKEMNGARATIFNTLEFLSLAEADHIREEAELANHEVDLRRLGAKLESRAQAIEMRERELSGREDDLSAREAALQTNLDDLGRSRDEASERLAFANQRVEDAGLTEQRTAKQMVAAESRAASADRRESGISRREAAMEAAVAAAARRDKALAEQQEELDAKKNAIETEAANLASLALRAESELQQSRLLFSQAQEREEWLLERERKVKRREADAKVREENLEANASELRERAMSHNARIQEAIYKAASDRADAGRLRADASITLNRAQEAERIATARRCAVEAFTTSLEAGLDDIAIGRLTTPEALDKRSDLAPARSALTTIIAMISERTTELVAGARKMRDEFREKSRALGPSIAVVTAREEAVAKREAAIKQRESSAEEFRTAFSAEIRTLRAVGKLAAELIKYVDDKIVARLRSDHPEALSSLTSKPPVSERGRGGRAD